MEERLLWDSEPELEAIIAARGPDARDGGGRTLLHICFAGSKHFRFIPTLLAAGADANARSTKGNTALHFAAVWFSHSTDRSTRDVVALYVVPLLVAYGADPAATNDSGQTPAAVAGPEFERLCADATPHPDVKAARPL